MNAQVKARIAKNTTNWNAYQSKQFNALSVSGFGIASLGMSFGDYGDDGIIVTGVVGNKLEYWDKADKRFCTGNPIEIGRAIFA